MKLLGNLGNLFYKVLWKMHKKNGFETIFNPIPILCVSHFNNNKNTAFVEFEVWTLSPFCVKNTSSTLFYFWPRALLKISPILEESWERKYLFPKVFARLQYHFAVFSIYFNKNNILASPTHIKGWNEILLCPEKYQIELNEGDILHIMSNTLHRMFLILPHVWNNRVFLLPQIFEENTSQLFKMEDFMGAKPMENLYVPFWKICFTFPKSFN